MDRITVSYSVKLPLGPKGLKQYTDLYHRDMDTRFGLLYHVRPGVGVGTVWHSYCSVGAVFDVRCFGGGCEKVHISRQMSRI